MKSKKEPIFTKDFFSVFFATFFSSMVMYLLMTTLTEYSLTLGATVTLGGFVSGIYVVGGAVARLFAGRGLEVIGWKRVALIATAIHLLACSSYLFVPNIYALLAVRFIQGMAFGLQSNATTTMASAIMPASRYGEGMGYMMLGPTLAVAVGPLVAGFIYDMFSGTGCFVASIVLSLLMFCVAFVDVSAYDPAHGGKKKESQDATAESERPKGLNKLLEVKALPVCLCSFLCAFGYVAIMSFYRLYAAETNLTAEFSIFFIVYSALLFVTRPMSGKILDRFGPNAPCIIGVVCQVIGLTCLALAPCLPTIIICAIGCALGFGTVSPLINATVCGETSLQRRSYAVSSYFICTDAGTGFGPLILGAVASALGYSSLYLVAAAFTFLALPLFLFVRVLRRK